MTEPAGERSPSEEPFVLVPGTLTWYKDPQQALSIASERGFERVRFAGPDDGSGCWEDVERVGSRAGRFASRCETLGRTRCGSRCATPRSWSCRAASRAWASRSGRRWTTPADVVASALPAHIEAAAWMGSSPPGSRSPTAASLPASAAPATAVPREPDVRASWVAVGEALGLRQVTPGRRAGAGQALHLAAARLGVMGLAALAGLLVARWLGTAGLRRLRERRGHRRRWCWQSRTAASTSSFFRDEVDREALPRLLAYLAALVLVSGLLLALLMPGLEDQARVVAAVIFVGMAAEISRAWWLLEPHRDGRLDVRGRRELTIRLASTVALVGAVALAAHPVAPAVGQAATSVLLLALVTSRRRRGRGRGTAVRTTWTQFAGVLRKGASTRPPARSRCST